MKYKTTVAALLLAVQTCVLTSCGTFNAGEPPEEEIVVSVVLQNAGEKRLNAEVVPVLEEALKNIPGRTTTHSQATAFMAQTKIRFNRGVNMNEKLQDAKRRLAGIEKQLPPQSRVIGIHKCLAK